MLEIKQHKLKGLITFTNHKSKHTIMNIPGKELTFKLPQQEQGVSILESWSSSWHILHSTTFPRNLISSTPIFIKLRSIFASFTAEDAASIDLFLLSSAASNVDSVSNRSTSNSKWSPIFKYHNSLPHFKEILDSLSLNEPLD